MTLAGWNGESDLTELPKATLTVEQASRYTWAGPNSNVRALQSPDKSTRIAATYYDANEIKLKLSFNEAYSGTLRLYAVDWDATGRREVISVNGQSVALSSDFSARRVGLRAGQRRGRGQRLDHGHLPGRGQRCAVGGVPGMRRRRRCLPRSAHHAPSRWSMRRSLSLWSTVTPIASKRIVRAAGRIRCSSLSHAAARRRRRARCRPPSPASGC